MGYVWCFEASTCCVALIADVAVERATVDEGVCGSDGVGPGWMLRGLGEPLLRFWEALREFVQGGGRGRRLGEGGPWKGERHCE